MKRLALLCAAAAALLAPGSAFAHATLAGTSPSTQSTVDVPPTSVVLRFDQSVTITARAIEVFAEDGRKLSGPAVTSKSGRWVTVPVTGAKRGEAYTVRWRATSSDGHSGSGVFTFGVGVKAPAPTEAFGSTGPTWTDDAARWAFFVALALLIGTMGIRLLVLREPLPERLSNWLYGLTAAGGIAVINVGIAAFVMRAADALQVPFVDLLYGDLSPIATKTRFGVAFVLMTLGYAAVTALVLLATGLSLSGHQGVEPNSTILTETADWLHLVAACLWVGGLVALATCVWTLAPELRRKGFLGFSRLATVLVAILLLAGVYLSIARLASIDQLWTTSYGQTLLVKIGIVCVALAWGAVHHFVVRPRLERGEDAPRRIGRSLLGESTIAILVLLLAAVLVNGRPPAVEPTGGARATAAQ
jgi:copper transport protein